MKYIDKKITFFGKYRKIQFTDNDTGQLSQISVVAPICSNILLEALQLYKTGSC